VSRLYRLNEYQANGADAFVLRTSAPLIGALSITRYRSGAIQLPRTKKSSTVMELTAVLTYAEKGGFIALNPETGTTSEGDTVEEAIANLREATALYLEEFPSLTKGHPLVTTFTVPKHA
jgi:predicted RNase H-like HicB family nuclease